MLWSSRLQDVIIEGANLTYTYIISTTLFNNVAYLKTMLWLTCLQFVKVIDEGVNLEENT